LSDNPQTNEFASKAVSTGQTRPKKVKLVPRDVTLAAVEAKKTERRVAALARLYVKATDTGLFVVKQPDGPTPLPLQGFYTSEQAAERAIRKHYGIG
jgi:hypothetical protein